MTSFFEKLKRGMALEEMPKEPEKEVGKEEKKPVKRLKKARQKKPEKEPEKEKIKVEKEPAKKEFKKKETREDFGKKEDFSIENLIGPEGELTIDVFETDENIVIQSAIAGVEPENLDIIVENDMVTIKGNREKQLGGEKQNYFRQECFWGKFSRKIILPIETDNSRAKAIIRNGVLTIKIPKIQKVKTKKLIVEE